MNLIQFLAIKLHQRPVFIDGMGKFYRGRSKGRPKSVVVPETIDAVHQRILQDRHAIYREIETTLGFTRTSIHSILPEHLIENKICLR